MVARDHNKILSIMFFVQAGLELLGALFIGIIYGGIGIMMLSSARRDEEQVVGGVFVGLAIVVGLIMAAFTFFHFFVGWKMHKVAPAGRVLGIIASCLCLLSFPLGTALGVYGLWFFFGDMGKELYLGQGNSMGTPPPPPNSWA
jgi:hypothetical protein